MTEGASEAGAISRCKSGPGEVGLLCPWKRRHSGHVLLDEVKLLTAAPWGPHP
jgi:hypothetical protein